MSAWVKIQEKDSVKIKIVKLWAHLAITSRKLDKITETGKTIDPKHVASMIRYRQSIVNKTRCALTNNENTFSDKMKQFIRDRMNETKKYIKLDGGAKENEACKSIPDISDAELERELIENYSSGNSGDSGDSGDFNDVLKQLELELKREVDVAEASNLVEQVLKETQTLIDNIDKLDKHAKPGCGCVIVGGKTKNKRGKKTKRTNKKTRRNRKRR